jgi:4-hydroxybenzoate polyprenyltransferase
MAKVPRSILKFIVSFVRLTRVGNLVIIACTQYFTAFFLMKQGKLVFGDLKFFLLSVSTVMIAAAGYIINDYYDIKIDFINKPDRVVIGKSITRRYAILFHTILSGLGILIGAYVSLWIGAVNVISVFLLWLYSNLLKRLPFVGNLSVAFLTALALVLVDLYYHSGNYMIYIYASFAFFMTLIREIIKDMEDLKGDNSFGCKTLPIVWGIRKTKQMIYFLLAVLVITVVVLNFMFTDLPVSVFVLFVFILYGFLHKLIRADTTKDYYQLSSICKWIMLFGILSMVFVYRSL